MYRCADNKKRIYQILMKKYQRPKLIYGPF